MLVLLYSGYAVNSNKILFWSVYGEILEEASNHSKFDDIVILVSYIDFIFRV